MFEMSIPLFTCTQGLTAVANSRSEVYRHSRQWLIVKGTWSLAISGEYASWARVMLDLLIWWSSRVSSKGAWGAKSAAWFERRRMDWGL